jgi:hypothetical protein
MTLSARNSFFRGGIALASISLGLIAIGGYFAFPACPETTASAAMRSGGIVQRLLENLVEPSAHVPYWTILGAAVYSLISIIFIYYFFEKTQSPEILFFGFFVISLSLEFTRITLPLKMIFSFPAMYLITASQALLFGRYFGLFSLFAASVYAAGLDMQKQQNILFMIILASLIIVLNVPIDSLVWDSSFMLRNGYRTMLAMVEAGILVTTVISFFIAAYIRGSRAYVYIGIGIFLTLIGRNILLNSDTWFTPLPGFLLLVTGTLLVCALLHREYLWL